MHNLEVNFARFVWLQYFLDQWTVLVDLNLTEDIKKLVCDN